MQIYGCFCHLLHEFVMFHLLPHAFLMSAADFALLQKWGQQVTNRVGTRGLYSPDATRTVTWSTHPSMSSSIVDAPLV